MSDTVREIPESEVRATVARLAAMPSHYCRREAYACYLCGWAILYGHRYHGRGDLRAHAGCVAQYLIETKAEGGEAG